VNAVDSRKGPSLGCRTLGNWMRANLTAQGYCLSDDERRRLAVGLRFSTGTCLLLVITALALESPAMSFALTGVGLIADLTSRHPFDLVWNHLVRHLTGGPALGLTRHGAATRSRSRRSGCLWSELFLPLA
jgi:hypothetical protein